MAIIKNPKFIILLYHKIGICPKNAKFPGLYVTEENFESQVKYLKNHGYAFLTLSELKALHFYYYHDSNANNDKYNVNVSEGDKIPNNSLLKLNLINEGGRYVAITFDDGSRSVYSNGLNIIKENGVKATVFMVSGLVGGVNDWDIKNGENKDEMLTVNDLKKMADCGMEIGAHTKTHPHLSRISPDAAYNEIFESKNALERLLDIKINFFAYPYGDYNKEVKTLAEKAGFWGACITKTGIVKKESDFFALNRVAIRHNTNLFKFKRKIFKVKLFY
ncbi:MAG: polysaccharide deacetylase family protein [Deltaproteobacteria bacterium]|nr:polysaccharide deacetylase family protein [Deltaproteobacteria bacterium]